MGKDGKKHFCYYDGLVSRCSRDGWQDQEPCDFAIKSAHRDCCINFCDDARCWSPDANIEARIKQIENIN